MLIKVWCKNKFKEVSSFGFRIRDTPLSVMQRPCNPEARGIWNVLQRKVYAECFFESNHFDITIIFFSLKFETRNSKPKLFLLFPSNKLISFHEIAVSNFRFRVFKFFFSKKTFKYYTTLKWI